MDAVRAMEIIVRELETMLSGAGFTHESESESLTRPLAGGRQSIGIALWDRASAVDLSLLVAVRLNAVEDIFHRFSGAQPEHRILSDTIVTPFNYFVGGPSKVRLVNEEELQTTLAAWREPMLAEVLPYLDTAQDVATLDKVVNIDRDILNILNPPHGEIGHIILAKLARNPEYRRLVDWYRAEIVDIGMDAGEYERVVEYLDTL